MMIKRVMILIALFVPCVARACGCGYAYHAPVAHTMRVQVTNPVAKHPVMIRRVGSARRNVRY